MAMGATTLASYVFQTIMARILSTLEFGELSSMVATLNIVTIPIFGLGMAITRDVAAKSSGGSAQVAALTLPYTRRVGIITLTVVLGVLVLSPWLRAFLQLSSLVPLVFLMLLVTLTNLVGMGRALLLGLHDFTSSAVNQVVEAVIRLASSIAFAAAGFASAAGFGGYLAGLCAALLFVIARIPSETRSLFIAPWRSPDQGGESRVSAFTSYDHSGDISWQAIIVTGAFIVLLNMDLVVVKHFLPPTEAGQYAAVGTLARVLFVITNAFDVVLFPAAAAARAAGTAGSSHLRTAILSVATIIIPLLAVYWLTAAPLLNVVFGARYVEVAPLLAPYGVSTSLLGVSTLIARYRLAVGRPIPSVALLALVAGAAIGFIAFHESLAEIVGVLLAAAVASLGIALTGAMGPRRGLALA